MCRCFDNQCLIANRQQPLARSLDTLAEDCGRQCCGCESVANIGLTRQPDHCKEPADVLLHLISDNTEIDILVRAFRNADKVYYLPQDK